MSLDNSARAPSSRPFIRLIRFPMDFGGEGVSDFAVSPAGGASEEPTPFNLSPLESITFLLKTAIDIRKSDTLKLKSGLWQQNTLPF